MKNVLILGATGMVGKIVLEETLKNKEVGQVTAMVRKAKLPPHQKLKEVVVSDFENLTAVENELNDIDVVCYCIGVYTGAVPKDEFRKITVDLPLVMAKAVKAKNPEVVFCLLSGQGADRSEKSRIMFARQKGEVENQLASIFPGNFKTFRPGYIQPVEDREAPNFSYKLFTFFHPIIKLFGKSASITSAQLAQVMLTEGIKNNSTEEYENRTMIEIHETLNQA